MAVCCPHVSPELQPRSESEEEGEGEGGSADRSMFSDGEGDDGQDSEVDTGGLFANADSGDGVLDGL